MNVAVWDTYVRNKDGNVLHFDIIVPHDLTDKETVYRFGQAFLNEKGEPEGVIDAEQCQLCHIEQPTEEMEQDINNHGYYILKMDDIPVQLPESPTRRDIILHLRAHYAEYRFADFKGKSLEDVQQLFDHQQ